MDKLTIRTDNRWKPFKYGYEVPRSVLEEYDYLDEYEAEDGFFRYKGQWYHISDFMTVMSNFPQEMRRWDGYFQLGYSDGLVLKVSDDNESYIVGRYYE